MFMRSQGAKMKSKWRSFQDARKFAQKFNFKNKEEWFTYARSGNLPKNIPRNPQGIVSYKKEWKGWEDFLGKPTISKKFREVLDFKNAKKIIHKLNIKSQRGWNSYCKSGKKPNNIPANPRIVYKKQWKGWGDWLGTGNKQPGTTNWKNFQDARKFARSLKFKKGTEWDNFCKSKKLPSDIPKTPQTVYKKEWKGMPDWLGTGFIPQRFRKYRSFQDARKFVHSLRIKTKDDWIKYTKSGVKPDDIPTNPVRTYKKEWMNWSDWLGSGVISPRNKSKMWLSYSDAKKEVKELAKKYNIKTWNDWKDAVRKGLIPDNIPKYPNEVYTKKEE